MVKRPLTPLIRRRGRYAIASCDPDIAMKMHDADFNNSNRPPVNRRGAARPSARPAEPSFDPNARPWPVVAVPQHRDSHALEDTIAKQSAELNLRCTQVADLYNLQQRQANELQVACEEIDRLSGTIAKLLDTVAQQDADVEAAKKQIALLENEKTALRVRLERTLVDFSEVSQRLLSIETAFNDRETTLASALEKIDSLNSELIAASADTFKVVAVTTSEKQRYRSELNQQKTSFEARIKTLETTAAAQDTQVKTLEEVRARLAKRVEILETLRKSERETAEFRIKELTEELKRERLGFSAEQRAFAALRTETTSILPMPVTQSNDTKSVGPVSFVSPNSAA
jgi:chromosome segregation ATPase